MDSLQRIKSRLRAVREVGQITKAMELVSATKMRRSQEVALKSRPYAFTALGLLERLLRGRELETGLLKKREIKTTLLVVVASDRSLAGSFNVEVFRRALKFLAEDAPARDGQTSFFLAAIGKKAFGWAKKRNYEIAKAFWGFGDFIKPEEVEPFADFIIEGFESGKWDRVITVSTHFRTTLKQEVLERQILPADPEKIKETVREIVPERGRFAELSEEALRPEDEREIDYIFEPSPSLLLESLIRHLIKMQVYHLILEANASEHSARRVAMKKASDNASELLSKLNLNYNKARQSYITKEMVEISSTARALD